jgi:plasmid stabilization system protein ParE
MAIQWSDFALQSLEEIVSYYELEAGPEVADSIAARIFDQVDQMAGIPTACPPSDLFPGARKLVISRLPYVAFIREFSPSVWQVIDIVHTARKLPKMGRRSI